jgi:hypothetical protein
LVKVQAQAEADGIDPSSNPELNRNWQQARLDIQLWGQQNDQIVKMLEEANKEVMSNPGKYDPEKYGEIIKEAKKQKNPGDAFAYLNDALPEFFEPEFDPYGFVKEGVIPKPDQDGRVTEVSRDEFIANTKNKLMMATPRELDNAFKQAKKVNPDIGTNKDADVIDEIATWIVDMNDAQVYRKVAPAKAPKTTSSGGLGGTKFNSDGSVTTDKVVIRPDRIDTTGVYTDSEYNVARVIRNGTQDDLPPVETYSETGELIDFRPVEFVLGANGKIGVKGTKIKRSKDGSSGFTVLADGTVITKPSEDGESRVEEVWVDYDRNKALFEGQTQVDMYKVFKKKAAAAGKEKQQNSEPIQITTKEEFEKLPKGTEFIYNGVKKIKG